MKRRLVIACLSAAIVAGGAATAVFAVGSSPTTQTYTYTVPATSTVATLSVPAQTFTQTVTVPTVTETVGGTTTSASPPPPPPAAGDVPYDPKSPWNTPIGASPTVSPNSAAWMSTIAATGAFSSDPDQYTIPLYKFDASTPLQTVKFSGYYSTYDSGDSSRVGHGTAPTITDIPIPSGAVAGTGTDGQLNLWDPSTGVEYGFWQFSGPDSSGVYHATNGYRYHTGAGYYGRFADGGSGRGAGTPYFAGLVRPWEIAQGHIDHALAFAFSSPSSSFVYPASKSDGSGTGPPEGTRIQLDPSLTDADFTKWGLSPAAKVIANALQTYGMYLIDNSGSPKIYLEDRRTAGWDSSITRNLVSGIPWSAFRIVEPPAAP